jgi:hypothetical protein
LLDLNPADAHLGAARAPRALSRSVSGDGAMQLTVGKAVLRMGLAAIGLTDPADRPGR